jgi:cellulose synthase/poly-beta-1,6-N-acetylglucosamine synthase-like glycosyltransferase
VLIGLLISLAYGVAAALIFCFSGVYGAFGETLWRDIAVIVVTITASLALAYASLLIFAYLRPNDGTPGNPREYEWHFLVPCRDEEAVIAETVSAARTTFPNCHVWVIDDASEDATAALVRDLIDVDDRVHLISRTLPNARLGKGKALNDAYREVARHVGPEVDRSRVIVGVLDADGFMSDDALAMLAGPQAFGDPGNGAAQVEVWMKNRDDRQPRGRSGWYLNALGRFLVRMQDIEFRTSNSAMQLFRSRPKTVGLGGNGQFTRLSVLDELAQAHGEPWGTKLSEDFELGLNIMALGHRNAYVRVAHVSQEALPYFGRLITQRTRWAQGVLECAPNIARLGRRHELTAGGWLETHYFIAQPVLAMLNLLLVPLLTVLAIIDGRLGLAGNGGDWIVLATGVLFLIAPYAIWGILYRRRAGEPIHPVTGVLYGISYVGYVYLTYLYYPRALFRLATGRNSWAKTRRNAEDAVMIAPTTPPALRRIPVIESAVLDELTLDLEGDDAALSDIVSRFALIWPRRLGNLRLAVASERLEAIHDAIGSIRVAATMLGAARLRVAAEGFTELVSEHADAVREVVEIDGRQVMAERDEHATVDFDACRRSVAEIARVGADTVVEIRARYLDIDTRAP